MLLDAGRSLLLVVDIQERLMPAIHEGEAVIARTRTLLAAASRLAVPILVTEQYPRGLGRTVAAVADHVPSGAARLEKLHFSAASDPAIADHLARAAARGRNQMVICGCEAHVCVLQTALGLRARGYEVAMVADAVSSRAPASVETAKARALQTGCQLVTTEMVVFEWLAVAGSEDFRALSALIK